MVIEERAPGLGRRLSIIGISLETVLSERPRILCIENDQDICELLSFYLGEEFDMSGLVAITKRLINSASRQSPRLP